MDNHYEDNEIHEDIQGQLLIYIYINQNYFHQYFHQSLHQNLTSRKYHRENIESLSNNINCLHLNK